MKYRMESIPSPFRSSSSLPASSGAFVEGLMVVVNAADVLVPTFSAVFFCFFCVPEGEKDEGRT